MIRCVFFDRDGIVNQYPGPGAYVERWEEFHLLPEFVEVLRTVGQKGFAAVVVTNQRGVALGRMTAATLEDLHRRLAEILQKQHGLALLDILYCPHDEGVCDCRKPHPGMLLAAARRHGIDLRRSWMIGDAEKDIEAGRQAGCRTILVSAPDAPTRADVRVRDMAELRTVIANLLDRG